MIRVMLYVGTRLFINKVVLVDVVKVEASRVGYSKLSRKATLELTTSSGERYQIKDMEASMCAMCIEKANEDMQLNLAEAIGKWIYIAERVK